jgi:outer membrane protein OmpA-like peptidoglycan-associated protein
MKTIQLLIIVALVAFYAGCASVAPKELVNARSAYQLASLGPASQLAPADLHKAKLALNQAEESFKNESDSYKTKDLAYAAQRKAELAGAIGAMAADKTLKDKANVVYQTQQSEIVKQGKQDLIDSEKRTAEAQTELDKRAAVKAVQDKADAASKQQQIEIANKAKQDLIDSEKRTADALAELAALAAVKEEERGLVVTLSGGVLFRSGDSNLLSSAEVKLDQVATALLAVKSRNIIIEGHTDSQGTDAYNQDLSQRRADAVRDYLVQKGYPADRIQTRGKGEGSPIADNASSEGRANNRRVEIVIERTQLTNR